MDDPFGSLTADELRLLVRGPQPTEIRPALATLTDLRFSRPDWIFERKLDGERCIVICDGGQVELRSRTNKSIGVKFPEIVDAFAAMDADDVIVDGEIVAFEGSRTSFERLQPRMNVQRATPALLAMPVVLYAFDLLYCDGHDTRALPQRRRKALLREVLSFDSTVRYTSHRNASGEAYYAEACAKGWEGLIAKRADAPYQAGRTRDWLKLKCEQGQEFVIGGWTEPEGSRQGFGALLIGYYDGDQLAYAGKVGTGFNDRMLTLLCAEMSRREIDESPFDRGDPPRVRVHWVRPELVGEVGFSEWTRDGRLRHPRFQGLRDDKAAREVVRERPT
jgi:bifunctional non-homologous end joining protein LigD